MVVALFVTLGCCCITLLYGEIEPTGSVIITEERKESTYAPDVIVYERVNHPPTLRGVLFLALAVAVVGFDQGLS